MTANADWPTYMKDGGRSGVTEDEIVAGTGPAWIYNSGNPPSYGFYPQPMEKNKNIGQQGIIVQTITYDYAYAPVIVGGKLFFGSSSDQAVYCLNVQTGVKEWAFFAEGAVRFAPVVEKGKLYFGSDDGYVYCLEAASGKLVWKYNASPEERRIIANGKVASQWPIRTSVAVQDGKVYFSAGLIPAAGGVYLCALDAQTGAVVWRKGTLMPSQGYILAAEDLLFVPNGRSSPAEFKQSDGSPLVAKSDLRRAAGSSFVGMMDDMVIYGPSEFGVFQFRAVKSGEGIKGALSGLDRIIHGKMTGVNGWRAIKKGETACFLSDSQIISMPYDLFRKSLVESAENYPARVKDKTIVAKSGVQQSGDKLVVKEMEGYAKWKASVKGGRSLIVAGNTVVVGGNGEVKGFDLTSGQEKFSFPVDGTAWELASDGGSLFASTSTGKIYCFSQKLKAAGEMKAAAENVFDEAGQAKFKALAALGVQKAGRLKGFCVIAGAGEGRLAYEVVKASEMQVVCVEKNPAVAEKARQNLVKAGVYGKAVVHVREDGKMPYAAYFANLVMSEGMVASGKLDFSGDEIYKLVQPYGGALVLASSGDLASVKGLFAGVSGWSSDKAADLSVAVHLRGVLPEAGEWSHMFANAQNTASSGDKIVRGMDYLIQWFGDPSPIETTGWHESGMGPLAKDGKLVNIKAFSVECVDAYNGTSLWYQPLPDVIRLNVAREGGSGCLDEKNLYIAVKNDCQVFDLTTGKLANTFLGPDSANDWGFIAVSGNKLFGSKQNAKATSASNDKSKDNSALFKRVWYASEPDFAVSSSVFALDKTKGSVLWNYAKPDVSILNITITVGDKAVYWVESRNPKIAADDDGSVGLEDFLAENAFMVAADIQTGKQLWEVPFQSKARTILYLSLHKGMLIETAPYHEGPMAGKRISAAAGAALKELGEGAKEKMSQTHLHFSFRAFDAATGKQKWESGYASDGKVGDQHNYNVSHPVIAGNFLYNNPAEQYFAKVNLENGEVKENKGLQRGKGCTTPTGSEYAMFFRNVGIGGIDLEQEKQFLMSDVNRTSCWMNVLPACGLVLMPEYSFGCMCGFPLQTSIVLAPGKLLSPPEVVRNAGGAAGRGDR